MTLLALRHFLHALIWPALIAIAPSSAEEIYKHTDSAGRVTYSTEKPASGKPAANLPSIKKESFDKRIENLKLITPPTCEAHGGVDCTKGKDADLSVICLDGFKDSALSHSDHCSRTRIATDNVTYRGESYESGDLRTFSEERKIHGFTLQIRNLTSVAAKEMEVKFRQRRSDAPTFVAGPAEIEPYGIAEYSLSFVPDGLPGERKETKNWHLQVGCDNCNSTLDILP